MKLRNKKTGKIYKLSDDIYIEYTQGGRIEVRTIIPAGNMSYYYDSLDKLNEEWEDYKPTEPLIEDEKIRMAVRAWAEAIGATRDIVFDGSKKIYSFFYENNKGGFDKLLIYGCNDLEELKRYTITELCGEEEDGD